MSHIETTKSLLQGRLDWIGRRWGSEFAEFIRDHHIDWHHLEAAEIWAGMCWGLITPDGPQDLDEAAALEDLEEERMEMLAQGALGHGF